MNNNIIFNITVCIMGILILFVHFINLLLKRKKRKDEKWLLAFIAFTILHFSIYLTFSIIRAFYTTNNFIVSFYTLFYVMNNIEVLLYMYMLNYVVLAKNKKNQLLLIGLVFFGIFVILDFINVFTKIFFYAENGEYIRSKLMIISQLFY